MRQFPHILESELPDGHAWKKSEDQQTKAAADARIALAKAERLEMELERDKRLLLPRQAFIDASAVLLAMLAQTLRSLPDQLERTAGLTPTQADKVQKTVDDVLASMSKELQSLTVITPPDGQQ